MKGWKAVSYLEYFDEIPPPMCLLIARTKGHRPRKLNVFEVAAAAGLPWQRVAYIGRRKSFDRVPLGDLDKFLRGCGITSKNRHQHKEYIVKNLQREGGFDHILSTAGKGRKDWTTYKKARFRNRTLKRL